MNLTEHFTLEEMTRSEYAIRHGIENKPDWNATENLTALCTSLEHLRTLLGKGINITSGFRSIEVNRGIGGVDSSQHTVGQAADVNVTGMTTEELYQFVKESVKSGKFQVDQCIQEFDSWVHISFNLRGNRGQFLRAVKQNGKTVYLHD